MGERAKNRAITLWGKMEVPLSEALERLTDEFIESGAYCDQTVMDLRDCIKQMLKENKINW